MITISLCMIVKNEEKTLARCLSSVGEAADEIIIMDTGSTDRTKEIAAQFTDKVYDFTWVDDFSAARNAAYAKATMEYILWLDADDVLLSEDKEKLLALKATLEPSVDTVMMLYNTGFDETGKVVFSYYRERLTKRIRGFKWVEPVHEYLAFSGKTQNADIAITHRKEDNTPRTGRNLRIYESRLARGETLSWRGVYYYARELKDNGLFAAAAQQFESFLNSGQGWVEDNIAACGELAQCYEMLGEKEKTLLSLLRSFAYDTPRGETCCLLGYYYKGQKDYAKAVFWFGLVLQLPKPAESWGFIRHDCWGYIPCLESAVCCDKLGEYDKAERFNEMAAGFKPDSASVAYNRSYFKSRRKEEK